MKKLICIGLFVITNVIGSWAMAVESPQALVQKTTGQMQAALRSHQESLQQDSSLIYDLVNQIVLPHFDFKTMSRWVLGKYWRRATVGQQKRFVNEFKTLLVRTYGKALLEYTDEKIIYPAMPALAEGSDEATVRSEVQLKHGDPVSINYSLHLKNGVWKVYDIAIDGISLVTNYRGSFASQIRNQGMDAMLAKLSKRNGGT